MRLAGSFRPGRRLGLALALLVLAGDARGASAPDWLVRAAKQPNPRAVGDAPAVVLLLDHELSVSGGGVATTRERRAVRFVKASGAVHAAAFVRYLTDTERVSDLRAWVLRTDGGVVPLRKDEIVDAAASPQDAFNESRLQYLDASRQVTPGDVFGYEWTRKGPELFGQLDWPFQDRLPTLSSRLSVALPEGWTVAASTLEGPAPRETREGARTTWEIENLPYIPDEVLAPDESTLAPRVAVSWKRPAAEAGPVPSNLAFGSWEAVSRYLAELSEAQAEPSAAVKARAAELTAGAATEKAKVEALCRGVQKLNYVSVQLGMGRGGGYKPHVADEVLRKGHGDCKDKATLLRSLLRAAGIRSWGVVLYSGDSSFVRKEWPSPQQFDHMIVAIEMKEVPEGAPAVVEKDRPPLLLFDPTSETVPFGDLPASDRFGWGLVVRAEGGSLVRMPGAPAGGFLEERTVRGAVRTDGSVAVRFEWQAQGPQGDSLRRLSLALTSEGLARDLESFLSGSLTGVRVASPRLTEPAPGRSGLETDLAGSTQARALPGGLLLLRPAIVSWSPLPNLPPGPRVLPILLVAKRFRATYELALPPGCAIDDLPAPIRTETPYGRVSSEVVERDASLVVRQELDLGGAGGKSVVEVPAAEYEAVRAFFSKVRDALNPAVVLKKP